jgi:hypothetical protein
MKASLVVIVAALIAGCSGGDSTSATPQSVADAWPAKWCQAEPGVAKQQLATIMGQPTSASDTHMSWSAHQYQFNAFLDPDGTVNQLDINLHSLSDAEKAALKCDKVRTRNSMAAQAAAAIPARPTPDACNLVSQAEMSAILGTAVVAEATQHSKCIYKSTSGISPYVEFSVDWGDGEAAMVGVGFAGRHEPGLTSPYDGIGDQAVAVGPALMIRTGEDLVTIVFSGVSDAPAAAKKIFDTAKAKM